MINVEEFICDFLNNTECEEYCNLTNNEIDEIAKAIVPNVEANVLNGESIIECTEWYANKYIYEMRGGKNE